MSLANSTISAREITYNGGTITVRGISYNDLFVLFRKFGARLDEIKETAIGQEVAFDVAGLMGQFPDVIDTAIALAAEEPDQVATVSRLPAGVKTRLALAVYELTLEDAGSLDALLGEILAAIKAVGAVSTKINSGLDRAATGLLN